MGLEHDSLVDTSNEVLKEQLHVGDDEYRLVGAIVRPAERHHFFAVYDLPFEGFVVADDSKYPTMIKLSKGVTRQLIDRRKVFEKLASRF